MGHVDVSGARLYVEDEGAGPAVLFLHGGLGDLRLWEPQARALAPEFPYTAAQAASYDAAEEAGDLDAMMEIDFAVWAPLGVDEALRALWRATPDALGVPEGTSPRPRDPAHERLEEVVAPTLVVVPTHDPPAQREVGATVARRVPGARLVEIDSDHYLTLRRSDAVTATLREFLLATSASPATSDGR